MDAEKQAEIAAKIKAVIAANEALRAENEESRKQNGALKPIFS